MLALAHHIQWTIDRSESADRSSVAGELGFTRARITQVLDLLLLAPDIQTWLLSLDAVDGVEPISERRLRATAREPSWDEQRTVCKAVWLRLAADRPNISSLSTYRRSLQIATDEPGFSANR
jgi:hypothetical protein